MAKTNTVRLRGCGGEALFTAIVSRAYIHKTHTHRAHRAKTRLHTCAHIHTCAHTLFLAFYRLLPPGVGRLVANARVRRLRGLVPLCVRVARPRRRAGTYTSRHRFAAPRLTPASQKTFFCIHCLPTHGEAVAARQRERRALAAHRSVASDTLHVQAARRVTDRTLPGAPARAPPARNNACLVRAWRASVAALEHAPHTAHVLRIAK